MVYAVTSYHDPIIGTTNIIIVKEGIYYGERLGHSLINKNKVINHGIEFWYNLYNHSRKCVYNHVEIKIRAQNA